MARCPQLVASLVGAAIFLLEPSAGAAAGQTAQEIEPAPPVEEEQPDHIDHSGQIVWNPHAPHQALFLPKSVLDATPLEELPLSAVHIDTIRQQTKLAEQDRDAVGSTDCYEIVRHRSSSDREPRITIEEWITSPRVPLVFIGTVVDAVEGWSAWVYHPATMVYVQVDDILRDDSDLLRVGQILAYSQDQATIDLYGAELGSRLPSGGPSSETGEELLFTGNVYPSHEFLLSSYYVFPVRDGEVIPMHWSGRFCELEPVTLDVLQRAIAAAAPIRSEYDRE